jgi:hypothetical protein
MHPRERSPAATGRPTSPAHHMVQPVLGEMFAQFTANLNALRHCDDPELVHQARVGWRRFRGAVRLFKPAVPAQALPSWQGLQPLLTALGELRDLDVACTQTLPALQNAFVAECAERMQAWQAMELAFRHAAVPAAPGGAPCVAGAGGGLRLAGHHPVAGRSCPGRRPGATAQVCPEKPCAAGCASARAAACAMEKGAARQHPRRKPAPRAHSGQAPALQHRGLVPALARPHAGRWHERPASSRPRLGELRDTVQAGVLAAGLGAPPEVVAFLRGVAVGLARPGAQDDGV